MDGDGRSSAKVWRVDALLGSDLDLDLDLDLEVAQTLAAGGLRRWAF